MKQTLAILFMLILLLCTGISMTYANGQDSFINKCGACHKSGGEAAPVNPGDKAAVVWKKYFKRKRHPVELTAINPDEMQEIISYLRDHAADSDHPASAVIPK
jgi:mono/diheme cytochrome c family protein